MTTQLQLDDTDALTAEELTFCSSALLILSQDHEAAELQKAMLTKGSEFLQALAEALYLATEKSEYTVDDHNELYS